MSKSPSSTTTPSAKPRELKDLTRLIQRSPGFPEVLAALKNGQSATIDGAWGSAGPLTVAGLGLHAPKTLVIVLAHVGDADDFRDDVGTFAGVMPEVFPAWDKLPKEAGPGDEVFGRRLRVVKALRGGFAPSVRGRADPGVLAAGANFAEVSGQVDPRSGSRSATPSPVEELTGWLIDKGMLRVEVVEVPGEFSVRGGILDVFPPDSSDPIRVEFFGDEVESIRPFDSRDAALAGQARMRSTSPPPLKFDGDDPSAFGHAADAFPARNSWVALVEPTRPPRGGPPLPGAVPTTRRGLFTVESTFARLVKHPSIALSTLSADSLEATCHLRIESDRAVLGRAEQGQGSSLTPPRVATRSSSPATTPPRSNVSARSSPGRRSSKAGRLELTVGPDPRRVPPDRRPDPRDRRP